MARDNLKTYGAKLNSEQIRELLAFALNQNDALAKKGKRGTPICIWGTHGIGKTQLIMGLAKEYGWTSVYCAPAQFEEMGELHGIPETFDPTPENPNSGDEFTVYRPPQWLKSAIDGADLDKPGLLILDDFNRADTRILQGCMQLLQLQALISWSLPPRWQIVLTANPEGGPYTVTEMDDAMLTRMLHVTMKFNAECWAQWATGAGIDSRGIDFVLTYPEVVNGIRTTARSLTQFFEQIEVFQELETEKSLQMVSWLGQAAVDNSTVEKFLYFCKHIQGTLLQPEEILKTNDFNKDIALKLKRIVSGDGQGKRNDRLQTICTRLYLYVTQKDFSFKKEEKDNVIRFLLNKEMDPSILFNLHRQIANSNVRAAKELVRDPKLARFILQSL